MGATMIGMLGMPKRAAGLTVRQVETRKAPGFVADGGGLYLQITPAGAKTWVLRFQIAGRRRDMGLGSASVFSLVEARERAREARRLVVQGIDPIEARRAERSAKALDAAKAMSFRQSAQAYIAAHRAGWRNDKHAAQWGSTLESYAFSVFGDLPVGAVDTTLVAKALEQRVPGPDRKPTPLWMAKPETASRVRGRVESILDRATAHSYRQGENPAALVPGLLFKTHNGGDRIVHSRLLDPDRVPPSARRQRRRANVAGRRLFAHFSDGSRPRRRGGETRR